MSILGIDVSTAQGQINWSSVAGDGIAFTYIKATEGLQTDGNHEARAAYFRANWARAGQAGLSRGAYHFFRPNEDGQQQADIFLQMIQSVGAAELPPMVDVESESGVPSVARATFVAGLTAFLTEVKAALGVSPFIYTNTPYWNAHLDDSFGDYPLWIANYGADARTGPVAPEPRTFPLPTGFDHYVLWQFAEYGTVSGISGPQVDLDVYNGTLEDLLQLAVTNTPITVTVNGNPVTDAAGFLTSAGASYGWIRPISDAIGATIVDFSNDTVTLALSGQDTQIAAQIQNGRAFVHLGDLDHLPGVNVAYEGDSQTVAITTG